MAKPGNRALHLTVNLFFLFLTAFAFVGLPVWPLVNFALVPAVRPRIERHFGIEHHRQIADRDVPASRGEVALPGGLVRVSLNQDTIEGAYKIEDAVVKVDGESIEDLQPGGSHDYVQFEGPLETFIGVGQVDFRLPRNDALLGRSVPVSYRLTFLYPVLTGAETFRWESKLLSGSMLLGVCSKDELRAQTLIDDLDFWIPTALSLLSSLIFIVRARRTLSTAWIL